MVIGSSRIYRIVFFIMLTGHFALLFPHLARARCLCACIDGEVKPLCDGALDIEPICAPKLCPVDRPSAEPAPSLRLPPAGTKECRLARVAIGRGDYEWHTICE